MTRDEREEASFYFERALQCRRQGRNQEAISCFERVVRIDPNNYPAWNNMGNAHSDTGNPDAAVECWRSAVKVKPDYAVAWHNMGRAFLIRSRCQNQSDLTEAAACLEEAVAAEPGKQESWALLGTAQNFLGNISQAENCLAKAVRLKPNDEEAQNLLAIVRKKKRNTEPTTGIQKGKIYSISLNDGSARLFKVLAVSPGAVEVLPINAAEPSRFAGGPMIVRASAVVSFFEADGPWSAYGEGGRLEHKLGVEY